MSILEFTHRFRHVTAFHVQHLLGHTDVTSTRKKLTQLTTRGYLARQYSAAERASNNWASYYLTESGLELLRSTNPRRRYRMLRSVRADASMKPSLRMRCHLLANTYVYFKRYHNGQFGLSTSFDLKGVSWAPSFLPDGFVRYGLSDTQPARVAWLEVYGLGRSTFDQAKRLKGYFEYLADGGWLSDELDTCPNLMFITPSPQLQYRLIVDLRRLLESYTLPDCCIFITNRMRLGTGARDIWYEVHHGQAEQ